MHLPLSVFKQHLGKRSKRSYNSPQCPLGVLIYFYGAGSLLCCGFFLGFLFFLPVPEVGFAAEQRWCRETEASELQGVKRNCELGWRDVAELPVICGVIL